MTLDTLAGSQCFSTVDLLSGYWQVEMTEEARHNTVFCTTEGLYEFNVLPFGLCPGRFSVINGPSSSKTQVVTLPGLSG